MIELTDEERAFANRMFDECQDRVDQIVTERWAEIATLAEALLVCAVLNAEDIDALLRA
jgi:hypothetical protein